MFRYDPDCLAETQRDAPSRALATAVTVDLTERCSLACDYCFRGGSAPRSIKPEVGRRVIDWMLESSGDVQSPRIWFFGGEPLLEFELIKELVAYAERRQKEYGKRLQLGATTNLMHINGEVLDFWREHRLGLNCSLDGCRDAHDTHRKLPSGKGSWDEAVRAARMTLEAVPSAMGRATVTSRPPLARRRVGRHGPGSAESLRLHHCPVSGQ